MTARAAPSGPYRTLSLSIPEALYRRLLREKHRRQQRRQPAASIAGILREAVIWYEQKYSQRPIAKT